MYLVFVGVCLVFGVVCLVFGGVYLVFGGHGFGIWAGMCGVYY